MRNKHSSMGQWCLLILVDGVITISFLFLDPMEWNEAHVQHWISWAIKEFNLVGVIQAGFGITGKELCEMQHSDFVQKVPHDKGDVFWTHLELLRKCKFVGELITI